MSSISRRSFLKEFAAAPALACLSAVPIRPARSEQTARLKFSEVGWCWDGQGFNGGVNPSIFGAGEGTKWFGLKKTAFMFYPNTALALEKLREFDEVICEISKWKVRRCGKGVEHYLDGKIETKCREAAAVGKLSRSFPNVTGAIDDDLLGVIRREKITPQLYAKVRDALRSANPELKLRCVVYSHELTKDKWAGFTDLIDTVELFVWKSEDLVNLARYVAECRDIFPKSEILIGCYLRDFTLSDGVPMKRLKHQWEVVRQLVYDGVVNGYSILGGFLIDMHPDQARWVRDFIAAH